MEDWVEEFCNWNIESPVKPVSRVKQPRRQSLRILRRQSVDPSALETPRKPILVDDDDDDLPSHSSVHAIVTVPVSGVQRSRRRSHRILRRESVDPTALETPRKPILVDDDLPPHFSVGTTVAVDSDRCSRNEPKRQDDYGTLWVELGEGCENIEKPVKKRRRSVYKQRVSSNQVQIKQEEDYIESVKENFGELKSAEIRFNDEVDRLWSHLDSMALTFSDLPKTEKKIKPARRKSFYQKQRRRSRILQPIQNFVMSNSPVLPSPVFKPEGDSNKNCEQNFDSTSSSVIHNLHRERLMSETSSFSFSPTEVCVVENIYQFTGSDENCDKVATAFDDKPMSKASCLGSNSDGQTSDDGQRLVNIVDLAPDCGTQKTFSEAEVVSDTDFGGSLVDNRFTNTHYSSTSKIPETPLRLADIPGPSSDTTNSSIYKGFADRLFGTSDSPELCRSETPESGISKMQYFMNFAEPDDKKDLGSGAFLPKSIEIPSSSTTSAPGYCSPASVSSSSSSSSSPESSPDRNSDTLGEGSSGADDVISRLDSYLSKNTIALSPEKCEWIDFLDIPFHTIGCKPTQTPSDTEEMICETQDLISQTNTSISSRRKDQTQPLSIAEELTSETPRPSPETHSPISGSRNELVSVHVKSSTEDKLILNHEDKSIIIIPDDDLCSEPNQPTCIQMNAGHLSLDAKIEPKKLLYTEDALAQNMAYPVPYLSEIDSTPSEELPLLTETIEMETEVEKTPPKPLKPKKSRKRKLAETVLLESYAGGDGLVESPIESLENEEDRSSRRSTRLRRKSVEIYRTQARLLEVCESDSPVLSADDTDSPNLTDQGRARKRKGRAEKKKKENIEDIYLNKLYKKPTEKLFTTIFEDPCREQVFSQRRQRRSIAFDMYTVQPVKTKRRTQKATKLGWGPSVRKKNAISKVEFDKKLQALEDELDDFETIGI